jgi:hypothetical protein
MSDVSERYWTFRKGFWVVLDEARRVHLMLPNSPRTVCQMHLPSYGYVHMVVPVSRFCEGCQSERLRELGWS